MYESYVREIKTTTSVQFFGNKFNKLWIDKGSGPNPRLKLMQNNLVALESQST